MRREPPRQPRKAIRFPLEAPIAFRWADRGIEKRGEGRTHDISEIGAFVLSTICPPAGSDISFNILLPTVPGIEPTTRVEAVGRVLRVEQAHGRKGRDGFAILARHTLLRVNNRDEPDAQSR
jgi:PilZ domain-containing protein